MGVFLACQIWISYLFLTKTMFLTSPSFLPHFCLLFLLFTEKHYFVVTKCHTFGALKCLVQIVPPKKRICGIVEMLVA